MINEEMIYVKTDYVPNSVRYLTAGKVYAATQIKGINAAVIFNDAGLTISISPAHCMYLQGYPWTICNADGTSINKPTIDFSGKTPLEIMAQVLSELVEVIPQDALKDENLRDHVDNANVVLLTYVMSKGPVVGS